MRTNKNQVGHGMMDWNACLTCKNFPGEDQGGCNIGNPELSIGDYEEIFCEDYEESQSVRKDDTPLEEKDSNGT